MWPTCRTKSFSPYASERETTDMDRKVFGGSPMLTSCFELNTRQDPDNRTLVDLQITAARGTYNEGSSGASCQSATIYRGLHPGGFNISCFILDHLIQHIPIVSPVSTVFPTVNYTTVHDRASFAYSFRMAFQSCKATHLLLRLVFVILAIQWSLMMPCEGRGTGSHEENGVFAATDPSGQAGSMLEGVTPVTRPLFQSIVNLVNLWATADKTEDQMQLGNEIESEEEEKFFDTSDAEFVYTAETEPEEQEEDGEPYLRMPTENSTMKASCETGNLIDDCWRCDSNWEDRRQQLASCGLGFGQFAQGGKGGKLYKVNTSTDDLKNPAPGTLRYGATQKEPLWIIFAKSMTIQLKGALKLTSFKTIDGRGAEVHLVGRSQITIEGVSNVIVHGIHVHDIVLEDAIHIKNSSHVWIDHCYLARAYDGLVDVTKNSTNVTVSNCFFEHHNKVMLFGADAQDEFDRNMQVTVAFSKFGTNLTQRMPRCRYGNCHVANNFYTSGWNLYAIGGSEDPTILSQGNRFVAPNDKDKKEITRRMDGSKPTFGGWKAWDWTTSDDILVNGAKFTGSGVQDPSASNYDRARSFKPLAGSLVEAVTAHAGPLKCSPKTACG